MHVDPYTAEPENLPPLWKALSGRDFGEARRLVKGGASIDEIIEDVMGGSDSFLHRAARDGSMVMLEFCLSCGCPETIETFDYVQRTPLICAAEAGHVEAVQDLLEAGANPNSHNEPKIGTTAIIEAVRSGHPVIVKLLLEAGADPTIPGWMAISAVDQACYEIAGGLKSGWAKAIRQMLASWPGSFRDYQFKKQK